MTLKGNPQRTKSDEQKVWAKLTWLSEENVLESILEDELRAAGVQVDEGLQPLSLADFMRHFWPVLEPNTPLAWGMPLDAMCLHLEAAQARLIRRLIINVPPGTSKSTLCNIFFPAWVWAEKNPSERFLTVAFTEELSMRDSTSMRRLIESDEFRSRYGEKVRLMRDQNAKGYYDTTKRGRRLVKPMQNATGARAGILIVDDPNNATEIDSRTKRKAVTRAYDESLSSRASDPKTYVEIVVQQRLHEEDLTGHLIKSGGGWCVLRLPEEYDPDQKTVTHLDDGSVFWEDPRTERGELLHPTFRDRPVVDKLKKTMGTFAAAGQLQQQPVPAGGGIVKSWWWRYHAPADLIASLPPIVAKVVREDGSVYELPVPVVPTPESFDLMLTSGDMSFKDTSKSDFVVIQAHGLKGANRFLLDQVRGRLSFVRTLEAYVDFTKKHPDIDLHLIEEAANGSAVMSVLHDSIPGLVGVNPDRSKEARVNAASPAIEAGNWYLPHPSLPGCAWVASEYLPEWAFFPNGANDDQIDATTQAEDRFKQHVRAGTADEKPEGVSPVRLPGLAGLGAQPAAKWRR